MKDQKPNASMETKGELISPKLGHHRVNATRQIITNETLDVLTEKIGNISKAGDFTSEGGYTQERCLVPQWKYPDFLLTGSLLCPNGASLIGGIRHDRSGGKSTSNITTNKNTIATSSLRDTNL